MERVLYFLLALFIARDVFAQGAVQPPNLFWSTPKTGTGKPKLRAIAPDDLAAEKLSANGIVDGAIYMNCNGSTNNTAGFRNALAATPTNGTLLLPAGFCQIDSTIVIDRAITMIGAGNGEAGGGTILYWSGASTTTPMFDLHGLQDSVFSDFVITATTTLPLATAIQSSTDVVNGGGSGNQFYRITINGTTHAINKGFAFVVGCCGATDGNNDVNTFIDVAVYNFALAAWSFEHSQTKAHKLINCSFLGGDGQTTQYGVSNGLGAGQGGSFVWYGGGGGHVVSADFHISSPNDAVIISGANLEGSGRLLIGPGSNGNGFSITIIGTRWSGDQLNADGKAIIYGSPGVLTLIGDEIGVDNTKPLQFAMTGSGGSNANMGVAIGNHIYTSLPTPFLGATWTTLSNGINNNPPILYPNTLMSGQQAVTIANLPTCSAAAVGQQFVVSNGQTSPPWNGAVSTTGADYAPVGCSQTGAATYGWVYR